MAKKEELLDLAARQSDALLEEELKAEERARTAEIEDKMEVEALAQSQKEMADALAAYNQATYQNMGQILGQIQEKSNTKKQLDETATRRENAYRYISGLGDTLSSLANLVGTAHGAENQDQTYNSSKVVEKAEAARKARKLEMEELSKRLDEMKTKQRELKASGSLEEAKMKFKHDKEMATLLSKQRAARTTAEKYADTQAEDAMKNTAAIWKAENKKTTTGSTAKPKVIKILGEDGKMIDLDVSGYKNFEKDYQRSLAAAIADGTSGLTEEEIAQYKEAEDAAAGGEYGLLNQWNRTHTPRQNIVNRMNNVTSITSNYP
jgi:hypothetical protein